MVRNAILVQRDQESNRGAGAELLAISGTEKA
jgi:hypothetical protein